MGFYRTHLFGSPSIVVYSPSVCKLILHSSERFKQEWPTIEALGSKSVITLQGEQHNLLKNFLVNALNHRDSLTKTVEQVQPSVVAALESWSTKGKIIAKDELRKVVYIHMKIYVDISNCSLITCSVASILKFNTLLICKLMTKSLSSTLTGNT